MLEHHILTLDEQYYVNFYHNHAYVIMQSIGLKRQLTRYHFKSKMTQNEINIIILPKKKMLFVFADAGCRSDTAPKSYRHVQSRGHARHQ